MQSGRGGRRRVEDGLQKPLLSRNRGGVRGTRETPGYKQHELTSSGGLCLLTFSAALTYGPCQTNANAPKMLVFQAGGGGGGGRKMQRSLLFKESFPMLQVFSQVITGFGGIP